MLQIMTPICKENTEFTQKLYCNFMLLKCSQLIKKLNACKIVSRTQTQMIQNQTLASTYQTGQWQD